MAGDAAAARNELPVVLPARILSSPGLTYKTIGGLVGLAEAHVREACLDGRALLLVDGLDEAAPAVAGGLRAALGKLAAEAPALRLW
ncbi:MAG: hypothetical protein IPP47_23030 [Bryobacterales bacterium]|nr:hypothetical protein [Bryobacterales bacterium]